MNVPDKTTELFSTKPVIKVCGLLREQDIRACITLGVDLLGFIFHPKSPRNTQPENVPDLSALPVHKVGVFVNQNSEEITAIMARAGLHLAQLHGGHSVQDCKAVGPSRVIKVLWPMRYNTRDDLRRDMDRFAPVCTAFLLDAGMASGGHGKSLDFTILQNLTAPRPWLLAGGLSLENITDALKCNPDGIDLNSGVESAPGVKNADKIKQMIQRIRTRTQS
ncbi:MAG: phosphoribosylanthranilate isomerase [Desulfoplanes sp.]